LLLQIFPGSDAAKAEAVYAKRYDTHAPMHKVADKGEARQCDCDVVSGTSAAPRGLS
jgi:hypothetical protein